MHLESFLVGVLIPCILVFGVLSFFSPGAPALLLREGYAGYVAPHRVFIVVPITSFLSSARGLEFLLFDGGAGALLQLL
jgi:hypothetical protein